MFFMPYACMHDQRVRSERRRKTTHTRSCVSVLSPSASYQRRTLHTHTHIQTKKDLSTCTRQEQSGESREDGTYNRCKACRAEPHRDDHARNAIRPVRVSGGWKSTKKAADIAIETCQYLNLYSSRVLLRHIHTYTYHFLSFTHSRAPLLSPFPLSTHTQTLLPQLPFFFSLL